MSARLTEPCPGCDPDDEPCGDCDRGPIHAAYEAAANRRGADTICALFRFDPLTGDDMEMT